MGLHELAGEGETEAGPLVARLHARRVGLLEGLEDALEVRRRDAMSRVSDRKRDVVVRAGLDGEANLAAALGELDRVRQQVQHDLPDPRRIGFDGDRRQLEAEAELLLVGERLDRGDRLPNERVEVEPDRLQVEATSLDPRQVEDVVDQLEQVQARAVDVLGIALDDGRIVRVAVALGQ